MGFGAAVTGGIVTGVILLVASMIISTMLRTNEAMVRASNQRYVIESDYTNTAIQITSVQLVPSNETVLILLQNTGSTKRWNYEHFDVIVQYSSAVEVGNSTTLQQHTEKLMYKGMTNNSLSAGSWSISSFTDDNYDPLILNSGESMKIKCVLTNSIASNSQLLITVVADNGVGTTKVSEVP
jgi:archaellum component FlaF (FlaF/FlaG flagellin family)